MLRPALLLLVVVAVPLAAQDRAPAPGGRFHAGVAAQYAVPQGDFRTNVNDAFGLGGHFGGTFDRQGVLSWRLDAGFLIYDSRTRRVPLGDGALGLVSVEVTTTSNILHGGAGLQLMAPGGTVRPYATLTGGFSYFSTTSSVRGRDNVDDFARDVNSDDGGLAWAGGGGVYIPLTSRVSLDLGARYHGFGNREFVPENGITIPPGGQPQIRTVRQDANAVVYQVGVAFRF
jgi:opacity protein-like surface antigen